MFGLKLSDASAVLLLNAPHVLVKSAKAADNVIHKIMILSIF